MKPVRRIGVEEETEVSNSIIIEEFARSPIKEDPSKNVTIENQFNEFTVDLYNELLKSGNKENMFLSPFSIMTCLSMVYCGAKNKTAQEMKDVLHLSISQEETGPVFEKLLKRLISRHNVAPNEMKIANSVFTQTKFPVVQSFLDGIRENYSGQLFSVDYMSSPDAAVDAVNRWVDINTKGKIKEILEKPIDPLLRMVLLNAIYFYAKWKSAFNKSKTKKGKFFTTKSSPKEVLFMHQKGEFNYCASRTYQVLGLDHLNDETMMVFVLPNENITLEDVETEFVRGSLLRSIGMMAHGEVDIYIPKFELETKYCLNDELQKLGMQMAFSEVMADFSGISDMLYMSKVNHKAYIKIDEEGTEAAAVTSVEMCFRCMVPAPNKIPIFKVDRPFMIFIIDKKTKNVLFLGKIVNPS